jgi:predicted RNA-binding protein YlqC (UPF0109 family)
MMAENNGAPHPNDFYPQPGEDDARLIELVGFLVQGIVSHPEEVEVEEFFDDIGSVYGVRVHADDVGRVIGREGRVASALRHLVKASAVKSGAHVTIEILTDDSPLAFIDDAPESVADAASVAEASATEETGSAPESAAVSEAEKAAPEVAAVAEKSAPAKAKPRAKKTAGATRGVRPAARRGVMPRGGDRTGGNAAPSSEESSGD